MPGLARALRLAVIAVLVAIVAAQGVDLGLACEAHCTMRTPHRCCEPFAPVRSPCCTALLHPPPEAVAPSHAAPLPPPVAIAILTSATRPLALAPSGRPDEVERPSTSPPVPAAAPLRI